MTWGIYADDDDSGEVKDAVEMPVHGELNIPEFLLGVITCETFKFSKGITLKVMIIYSSDTAITKIDYITSESNRLSSIGSSQGTNPAAINRYEREGDPYKFFGFSSQTIVG